MNHFEKQNRGDGKLLAIGTPEEIASNSSARAVYLGDAFSLDGSRDRLAS